MAKINRPWKAGCMRKFGNYLLVAFPAENSLGYESKVIYPLHEKGNWSKPGSCNGWMDGEVNWRSPTLNKSIEVKGKGVDWHGHIKHGKLVEA